MNPANKSARSPQKSSASAARANDMMNGKPVRATKTAKITKATKRKLVVRQTKPGPTKPTRGSPHATAKTVSAPVRLILRARAVMADRGFRSISALQRGLAAIGVVISLPQLIRVVDGEAKHINKDVIEGMLTLFQCGVAELLVMA
jgi:Cro/C1-type HTH DNA-binding domain